MCVKEFYGFNCGHCSIPYLRQCPLTLSNEQFPSCSLPAERPIFTNDNCHACSRVLWNARVLTKEAEHRSRHESGECFCETVFRSSDRVEEQAGYEGQGAQRFRTRGGRNKGKGKGASGGEHGMDCEGDMTSTSRNRTNGGGAGLFGGGYAVMHPLNDQSHYSMVGVDVYPGPRDHMIQGVQGQFELASYEYVGYTYGGQSQTDADEVQTGEWFGFSDDGRIPQRRLSTSQGVLGQPGAGMKWYSEQNIPALSLIPGYTPTTHTKKYDRVPRIWQRKAKSESLEKAKNASLLELKAFSVVESPKPSQAPMIVSSDMTANGMS